MTSHWDPQRPSSRLNDESGDEMSKVKKSWKFIQRGLDAPFSGGAQPEVIPPGIDGFVRESIQNSYDRRVGNTRVRVEYELLELQGKKLEAFLEAIAWPTLEIQLEALATQSNHQRQQIADSLEELRGGKIRLLVVRDHGTEGLSGPEFSSNGINGNFTKFGRDGMVPTEGVGGGAFGVGKSVFWNHSRIRTVIMSSRFLDGEEGRTRVFGRAYLPDHYLPAEPEDLQFEGHGFWHKLQDGKMHSTTFEEAGVGPDSPLSMLWRDEADYGTTVVSLMFDSGGDGDQTMQNLAIEIKDSVNINFWPLLHEDLVDVFVTFPGGQFVIDDYDPVFEPYVRAATAPLGEPIGGNLRPDGTDACSVEIGLQVPGRKVIDDKPQDPFEGRLVLGVALLSEDEAQKLTQLESRYSQSTKGTKLMNSTAFVRGPRMVVRYKNQGGLDYPYVAVLRGGLYRTSVAEIDIEDRRIEVFLRDSEPPAHNVWGWDRKIKYNYKPGWKKAFVDLHAEVASKIRELIKRKLEGDSESPDGLAKLLNGGGSAGNPTSPTFKFIDSGYSFDLSTSPSTASATVKVQRSKARGDAKAWVSNLVFEAKGEQGNLRLPILNLVLKQGKSVTIHPLSVGGTTHEYEVRVPAGTDAFTVDLTGSLEPISEVVRPRVRVQVDHRSRQATGEIVGPSS